MLFACTQEDGPAFDIPAGEELQGIQLELDADGTPHILSQVGMFYTTMADLPVWESRYNLSNVQSVVFSKDAGVWKRHGFRNLQAPGGTRSLLVRNADGRVQPMVASNGDFDLYARDGSGWIRRASKPVDIEENLSYAYLQGRGGRTMVLIGDHDWQYIVRNYADNTTQLKGNDGTRITLDSGSEFYSMEIHYGKGFNMVVGKVWPQYVPTGPNDIGPYSQPNPYISILSWKMGDKNPNLRKRVLERNFSSVHFAKVQGEDRLYGIAFPDTVEEYALRGEDLVFLKRLSLPKPSTDTGFMAEVRDPSIIAVDPAGCIHQMETRDTFPNPDLNKNYSGPVHSTYIHWSSCRQGMDTLALPSPAPDTTASIKELSEFRYAADGTAMVALVVRIVSNENFSREDKPYPSWLYLGRLSGGVWEWEKIAEYKGVDGT